MLEHLLGVFFSSLSHRWACPAKVSEISTEKIPDQNKNESTVQSTSSGCDQPGCAAPIYINMQCTDICNLHIKVSLAHPGYAGLSENVQRKPVPPMWPIQHALKTMQLSQTHSELHNTDLVSYRESGYTGHLCMSGGHSLRLPEVMATSLIFCFYWAEIQDSGKLSSLSGEKHFPLPPKKQLLTTQCM